MKSFSAFHGILCVRSARVEFCPALLNSWLDHLEFLSPNWFGVQQAILRFREGWLYCCDGTSRERLQWPMQLTQNSEDFGVPGAIYREDKFGVESVQPMPTVTATCRRHLLKLGPGRSEVAVADRDLLCVPEFGERHHVFASHLQRVADFGESHSWLGLKQSSQIGAKHFQTCRCI